MFRSLIYRTDFGNTIIREEFTATPVLGPNEASIFTDFVIPANQPLYLWRESGGSVIPNTEQNVNDWLEFINPPSGDDEVTYAVFTAYTGNTQLIIDTISAETENKIDKVTGATGNIPQFTADGNLEDSGFNALDFLVGATGGTAFEIFTGYTAATEVRLTEIENDLDFLSGETSGNTQAIQDLTDDINYISGETAANDADIIFLSGAIDQNTSDIEFISAQTSGLTSSLTGITEDLTFISGAVDQNSTDITFISGETAANDADIAYISGVTDTKQDQLSAGEGINATALSNDLIQVDLSSFTAIGGFNITLTGATNAVITDLRAIARGLEYGADYSANFTVRSLVDKGYVDAVAAGLDLKESVVVATTTGETDIDLTLGSFGGVIDGYTLEDGDRVLIKNQDSAKEENGIYIWSSGSSTFARAVDFEDPNVTSGAFTFVETGSTNGGSGWVLVTQDPITIGTTELTFTQFSSTGSLTAGNGIDITNGVISVDGDALAGDFIDFSGGQFNVTGLTTIADFNAYTGATELRLTDIENDITFISGVTDSNTDRIEDLENAVSGITGGTFVEVDTFTGYTATTDVRITNIENDLAVVSAQTDQNTSDILELSGSTSGLTEDITFISGAVDQNSSDIAFISAETAANDADIAFLSAVTDTKLDESAFTAYTATTVSNELFLIHTGGTNINTVTPTEIVWNSGVTIGSAYSWTGGSAITILEAGEYEVTYNVPFTQLGNNNDRGIGTNLILNNATVLDNTASAGYTSRADLRGAAVLATVNLTLAANDRLDLIGFRTGQAGTTETAVNVTILIKKKNTLQ
jgi:hypothetical protein